ncbi:NAD(P)-binding domain-containing protein, partial [Mycobacterium sp. NPDC003449]
MRVGFIGAGRMGAPMVSRIVGAGHQVLALGRSAEKRSTVAELGAHPVGTRTDAVRGADAVVVCVFTDEQVRELCSDHLIGTMAPGSVLVLHTTGSP